MKRFSIYKIILVTFGIVVLQSCFVAKEYEKPEGIVDEKYFWTDKLSQDSITIADISWKELFTDKYLTTYIQQGLENNLDIRTAIQNIAVAEAYQKQGKAGYLPTFGVGGSYTRSSTSETTPSGKLSGRQNVDQFDLSGNLSWELDVWGKIRSNHRATQAIYLQTVAAHQAVKTQLIAGIASTYYQLLALDEQKNILINTINNREQSIETIKALKEAGNVYQTAVNQYEAQLLNAKAQKIDLESSIKLYENTLSILLGENPRSFERATLKQQKITSELAIGVPVQLLKNRPDVIAAEYAYRSKFEQVNMANSSMYPSLSITANGGFQSMDFDKWFDPKSLFFNAVGSLTQPIFNKRALRTQKEVALADQETAWLSYKQSVLNATKEVSDALHQYQAADNKIGIKQEEFQLYDQATEFSEELLKHGMATYLEVLTARESALNAELSVVNTEYSKLNSMVQLYKAVGGGWR